MPQNAFHIGVRAVVDRALVGFFGKPINKYPDSYGLGFVDKG